MSDSLAIQDTLDAPSDGQAQQASDSQNQESTDGQPSPSGKAVQEQDNIRKLQSTYDRKLAEERKTFQQQQYAAQQQIQAMQQRLAQMEDESAPDDYSRLEKRLRRAEEEKQQYALAYQQAVQGQKEQEARNAALKEVADEFDVSVKDIEDATDYKSAVKLAVKAQQDQSKRKQQQDTEKRAANRPDLGGGSPANPRTRWDDEYQKAFERRDSVTMQRLLRERGSK